MSYLQSVEAELRGYIEGFEPECSDYTEGPGEPRLTLTIQFVDSLVAFVQTKVRESYLNGVNAGKKPLHTRGPRKFSRSSQKP